MKTKLINIKTNIITGFLGVGKTSTILNFMLQKPKDEKWSVLVNEFGDIGIDGAIYKSQGVAVKEIPGGCMCCSAGVPLQVAVNQVLKETRPDRLLIEPSGLGHPKRVLDTLRGEHFKTVLDIRSVICLIDPRNLLDSRYTEHENFIDQIALADILVANKVDLCDAESLKVFDDYVNQLNPAKQQIIKTQRGEIDLAVLEGASDSLLKAIYPEHHAVSSLKTKAVDKISAKSDGYTNVGLKLDAEKVFNYKSLEALFKGLMSDPSLRIKAILNTDEGWYIFNCAQQQFDSAAISSADDNRIEVISRVGRVTLTQGNLKEMLNKCVEF